MNKIFNKSSLGAYTKMIWAYLLLSFAVYILVKRCHFSSKYWWWCSLTNSAYTPPARAKQKKQI